MREDSRRERKRERTVLLSIRTPRTRASARAKVIVMQKSQFSGRLGARDPSRYSRESAKDRKRYAMPCDYHNNRRYYSVKPEDPKQRRERESGMERDGIDCQAFYPIHLSSISLSLSYFFQLE